MTDHKTPMDSRAAQALRARFATRGAQIQMHKRTGVSQSRLSNLAKGGVPSMRTARRLENEGIVMAWWDLPPVAEEPEAAATPTEAA